MGFLTRLATLPVSGPLLAGWWVLEQIHAAAENEYYDEERILEEIQALSRELEEGRIDTEEHAAAEHELLERLRAGRAR